MRWIHTPLDFLDEIISPVFFGDVGRSCRTAVRRTDPTDAYLCNIQELALRWVVVWPKRYEGLAQDAFCVFTHPEKQIT